MRLIAFSDSHGHVGDLRAALRVAAAQGRIDACAFLGDGIADFEQIIPLLQAHNPRMIIRSVVGNNDFRFFGEPTRAVIDMDGVKVFLAHGHYYGVRQGLERLAGEAATLGASAAVYGHTHQPLIQSVNGVITINPGAVCERGAGKPACAELRVSENGSLHARLLYW